MHESIKGDLLDSDAKFRALVENAVVGIYIIKNGFFSYVNDKFAEIFEYEVEELLGKSSIELTHKDDIEESLSHIKSELEGDASSIEYSFRGITKSNKIKYVRVYGSVFSTKNEKAIIGTLIDETQEKLSQKRLQRLANYDLLTTLFNRNYFDIEFEHAISLAKRNSQKLALLLFDVDNFKRVNDSLGHKAGDEILFETAIRIKNLLRDSDTFSRIGGDEFTIIIENYESKSELITLLEKIKKKMQESIDINGISFHISLSIGVSTFPENGSDVLSILKTADIAMYEAKRRGKNRFAFYNQESQENIENLELEGDLYKAYLNREFLVFLQPQVSPYDNKLVGAEALIRWEHPQRGIVNPQQFLEIASNTGLLPELDFFMIESTFKLLEEYRNEQKLNFTISVNISNALFQHQKFLSKMQSMKLKYGRLANNIQLELTENILMNNAKHSYSLVKILKFLGYKLSVDDFGTGYSSLSHIKTLEIDELKIDKSFIDNIVTNKNDRAIVKAIIEMCITLDLETVAEGVQTEAQLEILKEFGCSAIQGYYYAKALSIEDFKSQWIK
jgi:diguanylate cyclase (GGDEF)-like protein/PAS domain S-box-containing protein